MMHRRRMIVVGVVAAVIACAGCHRRDPGHGAASPAAEPAPIDVEVAPVSRGPVERAIAVTGTLFAEEDVLIAAKLPGRIAMIAKDSGDEVGSGELLAELERRDYELELEERRAAASASLARLGLSALPTGEFDPGELPTVVRARSQALNAKAKLDRARQLFDQDPPLLSAQDFADIETAYEVASSEADVELLEARATLAEARAQAAAVATAEQRLADTAVSAPTIAGRPDMRYHVAEREISVGEYVEASQPLFRLVATDRIKYRALVPDRFAGVIAVGQTARVAIGDAEARGNWSAMGEVSRIWPAVDPTNRTFVVEVMLVNEAGVLKPGAFAKGVLITGTDEDAKFVPASAVSSFAGLSRVYSIEGGKAVEHRVTLGVERDGLVEIVSGLDAEEVVASDLNALGPGVPVRPRGR